MPEILGWKRKPRQHGLHGYREQVDEARKDTVRHCSLFLLASGDASPPDLHLCPLPHGHSPPAQNLRPWTGWSPKATPGPTPCIQEKARPGQDRHLPLWQ